MGETVEFWCLFGERDFGILCISTLFACKLGNDNECKDIWWMSVCVVHPLTKSRWYLEPWTSNASSWWLQCYLCIGVSGSFHRRFGSNLGSYLASDTNVHIGICYRYQNIWYIDKCVCHILCPFHVGVQVAMMCCFLPCTSLMLELLWRCVFLSDGNTEE